MAADKGDAKGSQSKRTLREVVSTPGRKSASPLKKQARQNISFNQSALIYTKDLTNYKYF